MSDNSRKLSKPFHAFMIYFALWAFAIFAVLYGIKLIYEGEMNGYDGFPFVMLIIVNALLIALGLFTVKARFDLAAFRAKAPAELLGASICGAVLCLANYWVQDIAGDDMNRALLTSAFVLVCWGIGVYRYYKMHSQLFIN